MSRSSSSSGTDIGEEFVSSEQPNIEVEADQAEFSLRPYLFEPRRRLSSSDEARSGSDEDNGSSGSSAAEESRLNDLE